MVNGLDLSLRRYVLWTLLAVGSVLITLFSLFSADRFFEGMDGMMRSTMIRAAKNTDISHDSPQSVLNFFISARFEQQPEEIRQSFSEQPLRPYVLEKDLKRDWFFTRPHAARFLVMVPNDNGEMRYVSLVFDAPSDVKRRPIWLSHEIMSIAIGLAALGIFAGVLLLILRSVSKPVEVLQQWAANLDEKQLDAPIPTFRYQELNVLAALIHNSLQNVKQTLDRERTFVNHASHEIRTPIAVIRSSVELLQRLMENENGKSVNALARIDSASKTMTDLTETLLWLARDDEQNLPYREVEIGKTIHQLSDDLAYLLKGKEVSVHFHIAEQTLNLPDTASRIIIGNVIRNAFQHTHCGSVIITLAGCELTVENTEVNEDDSRLAGAAEHYDAGEQGDMGYGLGLKLITKLTEKLNWAFHAGPSASGYKVTLAMNELDTLR